MRRLISALIIIFSLVILTIPALPVMAQETANSVVVVLSQDVSIASPTATIHYSVTLSNQNVPGANPATVTLTFFPPGPTGTLAGVGPALPLATNLVLNVGDSKTYNFDGAGGAIMVPGLAVNLGAIPLNPDVLVAYADTIVTGTYNPPPPESPYTLQGEKNISVTILRPNTSTTVGALASTIYSGTATTLTVTEQNTGNVDLTNVSVLVTSNGAPPMNVNLNNTSPNFSSNQNTDSTLAPGEIWTWTLSTGNLTTTTIFTVTGTGTDPLNNIITYPGFPTERSVTTVTVINPNTITTIISAAPTVETGTGTILTVKEQNTGNVNLINVSVLVTSNGAPPMNMSLNTGSPNFSSNQNTDSTLAPGEIWTWTLSTGNLTGTTIFIATGTGTDTLNKIITFPEYQSERSTATVNVISPGTTATISAMATVIQKNTATTLTVIETNSGNVPLTNVGVLLISDGAPPLNVILNNVFPGFSSNQNDDSTLAVGEIWTWTISTGNLPVTTTFTATGTGTDPLNKIITYPEFQLERAQTTVSVIGPDTLVTIIPASPTIPPGTSTNLTITEKNTGTPDVPLTNVSVTITASPAAPGFPITLNNTSPGFSSNQNTDNILAKDEVWTWTLSTGNLAATTAFTATGTGTDPLNNVITYPAYPREQAQTTVVANNPNTRVTITSPPTSTGNVTLTVSEKNTGNVPLTNVSVAITSVPSVLTTSLNNLSPGFSSNQNNDNILDVGEEWTWPLNTGILTTDTTFIATGSGTDPLGNVITFKILPNGQILFPEEQDRVLVRAVVVPASSNLTVGLSIAAITGVMALFLIRKSRLLWMGNR